MSFWDTSWDKINADRLKEYIHSLDFTADNIIEYLHSRNVHSVCDAGCGCGAYTCKLAYHGFDVSGFDISASAVAIAQKLLHTKSLQANLKVANILSTNYCANCFDAVVSRDVLDHIRGKDGIAAIHELFRITKPGGIVLITLDHTDSEYETEPHSINCDGDYLFTSGKWQGMVFHPYKESEIIQAIPPNAICEVVDSEAGILVKLEKPL